MSMQNQAFIILAHKEPAQVEALLQQLNHQNCFYFLHVDKKVDCSGFEMLKQKFDRLVFVKRFDVRWGGASMLQATLAGIEAVLASGRSYSHIHLISGEDISLKPVTELVKFFSERPQYNFINYADVPPQWKHRYTLYHFFIRRKRNFLQLLIFFFYKRLVLLAPVLQRKFPHRLHPYLGSQWWSLSYSFIQLLPQLLKKYPRLLPFMQHVQIPDELFFQTLVVQEAPREFIINNNLRFIDWQSPQRGHPAYLDETDLPAMKNSDCFFARKIDFKKNRQLYQQLPFTEPTAEYP